MPETIHNANAAASTLFLGHNGEWWDFWLIVSVIFAALAAIAIGTATTGSIVSNKREAAASERALERYKAEAAEEVAKASERIAELSIQGEQLKRDTSEANARAAEAQLALERFRTPRTLSAEQRSRIADKVRPFGAIPFDFAIQTEPEAIDLMEQLSVALESAGWIRKPAQTGSVVFQSPGKPQAGIVSFSGLAIHIDDSRTLEWDGAASTLWKAIEAEGIAATALRLTDKSENADAIHIKIGKKP